MQTTNIQNTNVIKDLSIQINLSGLSFCILNKTSNTIEVLYSIYFEEKFNTNKVLQELLSQFETKKEFSEPFENVNIIYQNELCAIVPNELFKEEDLENYLRFNVKVLNTDFINFDSLEEVNAKTVFIPYLKINNKLLDEFNSINYYHSSNILIDKAIKLNKEKILSTEAIYININQFNFEVVVLNSNNELLLYNFFEYFSKEDFIYYILFITEQLGLDNESIKVFLSGKISEENSLFKIAYKYLRFVEVIKNRNNYEHYFFIEDQLLNESFLILNSFK